MDKPLSLSERALQDVRAMLEKLMRQASEALRRGGR